MARLQMGNVLELAADTTFMHSLHNLEGGLVHLMPEKGTGPSLAPEAFVKMVFPEHGFLLRCQTCVRNPSGPQSCKYFTHTIAWPSNFLYRLVRTPT